MMGCWDEEDGTKQSGRTNERTSKETNKQTNKEARVRMCVIVMDLLYQSGWEDYDNSATAAVGCLLSQERESDRKRAFALL